ncbi:4a-hydroxytetrahydrobiopterin dehydratase [Aquifex sp.]
MEKLTESQIRERLQELKDWKLEGDYITKELNTKNWKTTIFVVNAIAGLAEAHWHHPDLEVGFKRLKIKLTTHEAGGLTDKDFNLAKDIDELVEKILKR